MRHRPHALRALVVAAAALGTACPTHAGEDYPVRVVATIQPYADWAGAIGGERVRLHCLLPPGASPHTFEPSPSDVKQVARAHLYLRNGLDLDTWADKLLGASGNTGVRVLTLAEGLPTLPAPHPLVAGDEEGHGHEGGTPDPHLWLDPVRAKVMVERIAEALAALDANGAAHYRKRLDAYRAELDALDGRWRAAAADFQDRRVVTMHVAWTYLFDRYGVGLAAVVEPFPGKEPSARYLKEIVRLMEEAGERTLFTEPQLSPKASEILAREIGGKVVVLDPLGDPTVPERATYVKTMDYNLRELLRGLQ